MAKSSIIRWLVAAVACGTLVVGAALIGYIAHKNSWAAKIHSYLSGKTDPCCIEEVIINLGVSARDPFFYKVDAFRDFVHSNSVSANHDFDQDLHPYDTGGVIRALLEVDEGNREAIGLLCSSRANAMTGLLSQIGIQSRQVHVFSEENGSHTFLEVKNPEDGRWYIQDPDYDLIWLDKAKRQRLGLGEMLTLSLDDVVPCRSEDDCDWKYASNLRSYFGAAIYFNFDATPLIVVNQDRYDLDTVLEYTTPPGTITDFARVNWGNDFGEPVLSVIHGAP